MFIILLKVLQHALNELTPLYFFQGFISCFLNIGRAELLSHFSGI